MREDAGMPCAVQKMQGGRSQGILVVGIPCLHLLPKVVNSCDEEQGLFVLPSLV